MPVFSKQSLDKLATVDRRLYDIATDAIKIMDFTIITGHRDQAEQDADYAAGRSKLKWPDGKHNASPSKAYDLAPFPVNWKDLSRFYVLAGIILACAASRGVKIRWGGNWNGDFDLVNNKFQDIGHFELVESNPPV